MLIHPYNPNWIQNFADIKNVINEVLLNLNVSIEHIGSTSVAELAAKPIIDIDIVFDKNTDFEQIKTALEKLGYYHNGNQGVDNREVFKRHKSFNHNVLDVITHHIYVCPIDSLELQQHICFRDYLIANADARIAYQNLKYEIADEANQDKKTYAELKEVKAREFIERVIGRAKNSKKI